MINIITLIFLTVGAIFILVASLGLYRMPDFYLRLSTTVKATTFGVGFMLVGVSLYFDIPEVTYKAIAIIFFMLLTAPISGHILSKAAYLQDIKKLDKTRIDEMKDLREEGAKEENTAEKKEESKNISS